MKQTVLKSFLEVGVLLVGEGGGLGGLELGLVLGHQVGVNLDLGRRERGRGDELEGGVADELAGEPEEGALEVELWGEGRGGEWGVRASGGSGGEAGEG